MKTVGIIQSNYIPWAGYFHFVDSVTDFVFFDDVQYTRRDWRNRNQIKTPRGAEWLTIAVQVKGKFEQKISETLIADDTWRARHLKIIEQNYSRASGFAEYFPIVEALYNAADSAYLSEVNFGMTKGILDLLEIPTHLHQCSKFELQEGKSERLLGICQQLGAERYVSGPSAKGYLDVELFRKHKIEVEFFDYGQYAEYPQQHGPFIPNLSVIDLFLNVGRDAKKFIRPIGRTAG